jgi:hypothetical protein
MEKIPMRRAALLALPLLFATYFVSACSQSAATIPTITYPETKRCDVVEKPFGQTIADPYRWLENDAGKIADGEKFRVFVKVHGDKTQNLKRKNYDNYVCSESCFFQRSHSISHWSASTS